MKNIFVYIAKTKSNEKCTYESIEVKDIKCGYNYSFKDIIQQIMYKIECHIPLQYLKFVQSYYKKNIKGSKVLAIHYRGTSYKTSAGHPFPPTFKQMKYIIDKFISKKKYDKIFF